MASAAKLLSTHPHISRYLCVNPPNSHAGILRENSTDIMTADALALGHYRPRYGLCELNESLSPKEEGFQPPGPSFSRKKNATESKCI